MVGVAWAHVGVVFPPGLAEGVGPAQGGVAKKDSSCGCAQGAWLVQVGAWPPHLWAWPAHLRGPVKGGTHLGWVGVVCAGVAMLTPPPLAAARPWTPPGGVQPPPGGQQLLPR